MTNYGKPPISVANSTWFTIPVFVLSIRCNSPPKNGFTIPMFDHVGFKTTGLGSHFWAQVQESARHSPWAEDDLLLGDCTFARENLTSEFCQKPWSSVKKNAKFHGLSPYLLLSWLFDAPIFRRLFYPKNFMVSQRISPYFPLIGRNNSHFQTIIFLHFLIYQGISL